MKIRCEICGEEFDGRTRLCKYCPKCMAIADKRRKAEWNMKKYGVRAKRKSGEVCCVCGGEFSSHYDGKPYCNKHYLRMYFYGSPDGRARKRTNSYDAVGDELIVTTARGDKIVADINDYDLIKRYSWCISKTGYPVANIDHRTTKMHQYLLGRIDGMVVDHIDGNPLNNKRSNLRMCDQRDNARNVAPKRKNRDGYPGVRETTSGTFHARIFVDGKEKYIGAYKTYEDAVKARKEAEEKYFGEYRYSKRVEKE